MSFEALKKMSFEKKVFYSFLLIHLLVWTLVGLIRTILPTDALEGIYWGYLHDFGTPKHPPLAGWLTYLAYIPFKTDLAIYLVSQTFIFFGFIYIYKLARCFLDETKSMLSVIILEGCWVYSYITGYYGFNPDVILLFALPAIAYYFYHCMHSNKASDWLKLGIIVGLAFLNKYQTAMLILPMAIWAFAFRRETFKNKFFYMAVTIAFFIFLPHLLWLVKYDFYPVFYFEGELSSPSWINHITAPLMFLVMQIALIVGSLLIYAALKIKSKSPFKLVEDYKKEDFWFLLLLGLGPFILHFIMGLIEGGSMRPRWGYEFWFMTGIMLFYFFPIEIDKKKFIFVTKFAYIVMFIIFLALGTLLSVEKNYRSRYPVSDIYNELNRAWLKQYDTPFKYVGGYIEWTLPLTVYTPNHPDCIQDNHGYKDPWISQEDLKKNGVVFIDRDYAYVEQYVKRDCKYLPADFKIEPVEYKFNVYNAFGMPREYTVYYFIVPPMK